MSVSAGASERLRDAVLDRTSVKGATHQFYRYPARFSPQFAKAFIKEFTNPGDLVVDPFVGGGTTLVEAMLLGRKAVGSDINSLAAFVSQVKTTPLSIQEICELRNWFSCVSNNLHLNQPVERKDNWSDAGYFTNIDSPETWRYQKLIQIAINQTVSLSSTRCSNFARCTILRTAQLALDGKKTIPPVSNFRKNLSKNFSAMLTSMSEVSTKLDNSTENFNIHVINATAAKIHEQPIFAQTGTPKLILTSPPYPGVHVLYHRWQVRGRRETPAPYWIANKLDGDGERYYTLGNRHERELKGYYENLELTFGSIAKLADSATVIAQLVAFSEPEWQLPKYLEVMKLCGLVETDIGGKLGANIERIWRDVPGRKWHAEMQRKNSASREVILMHRLR